MCIYFLYLFFTFYDIFFKISVWLLSRNGCYIEKGEITLDKDNDICWHDDLHHITILYFLG